MIEQETELDEWQTLCAYRLSVLLGLGLPYEDAEAISEIHRITVHSVRELLAKGCPVQLVIKILG